MTTYVQRIGGGSLEIRSGHTRLRAALSVFGYANVTDVETDEQLRVHEVDGQLVVLSEPGSAEADAIATAALERAAR